MIQLQTITEIAVLFFVVFYVAGVVFKPWMPLIIIPKVIRKNTIIKKKVDKIFMETEQELLKLEHDNAQNELKDLQKQILDLKELRLQKMAELKTIKEDKTKSFQDAEVKQKEINEVDEQAKKLLEEEQSMDTVIKMAERKIGQQTRELSMLERSIELGKKLTKDL